jgi:hypothetical protein
MNSYIFIYQFFFYLYMYLRLFGETVGKEVTDHLGVTV